jgi:protein gp37
MAQSSIEWTDMTWNPITGCTKISAGCKFCYAEVMARRLQAMGQEKYKNGFDVATHDDALKIPYGWKKPKIVFVNSMSDMFHEDISLEFIKKVFKVMNENPQHVFQVLTKRGELLRQYSPELIWTDNIWMGVSIESSNPKVLSRIDCLRDTGAKIKFLSCEPLIGALPNLNLDGIDWCIVGGESGRGKIRPMQEAWVEDIRLQCESSKVAFFFKQWGGSNKKKTGNELNGIKYEAFPIDMTPFIKKIDTDNE